MKLLHGNSLEVLKTIENNSIDSIVTDPPYELGFMGKRWDSTGIAYNVDLWRECLRVLKPGGHLLAFSGSRTYHRMTVAIEDAGFEVRDQIMWVYGSGFPKSLDVSKALDKMAGAEREVIGPNPNSRSNMVRVDAAVLSPRVDAPITAPSTDAARQWQGWGTALKPAHEPICVARKPLIGTVAENLLAHGTGALNINGCRVPTDDNLNGGAYSAERKPSASEWVKNGGTIHNSTGKEFSQPEGRWPANFIHDGLEQDWARFFYCAKASKKDRDAGLEGFEEKQMQVDGEGRNQAGFNSENRKSMLPRKNVHPTVKPTDLMRYLCRLVTPPGGVVLDPFMGSGSTGKAACLEGFDFIGIEMESAYIEIAKNRIESCIIDGTTAA